MAQTFYPFRGGLLPRTRTAGVGHFGYPYRGGSWGPFYAASITTVDASGGLTIESAAFSGSAGVAVPATGGIDLSAVAVYSTGSIRVGASGALLFDDLVVVASANVVVAASGGLAVDGVAFEGLPGEVVVASGGVVLDGLTISGGASVEIEATGGLTLDGIEIVGAGGGVVEASGGLTLDTVVFASSPLPLVTAEGSLVVDSVTFSGAGTGGGPSTLREAVYATLGALPGLSDYTGERIYFRYLPQALKPPLPATVTYVVVSRSFGSHLGGGNGVSNATVRVSCWSYLQSDAEGMATVIRNALHGYRGRIGEVEFLGWFLEDETDLPEPPVNGSETYTYQTVLTFTAIHRIAVTPAN